MINLDVFYFNSYFFYDGWDEFVDDKSFLGFNFEYIVNKNDVY